MSHEHELRNTMLWISSEVGVRGIFGEANGGKKSWMENFLLERIVSVWCFQPQAPDDGILVAEHEDNFSTLQLCA